MQTIMMEFIVECFAVSLSVATGIVFVYGCCKAINRLFEGRLSVGIVKVKHFVAESKAVDVRLSDGQVLADQKFVGFADFGDQKSIPFELKSWMVLESSKGRTFIKPGTVRSISEKQGTQS